MSVVEQWYKSTWDFALVISEDKFAKICGKTFKIPDQTVGFIPQQCIILPAQRKLSNTTSLLLVKQTPWIFSCIIGNLQSLDHFSLTISLSLSLQVNTVSTEHLARFYQYFSNKEEKITVESVFDSLYPLLCQIINELTIANTIEQLLLPTSKKLVKQMLFDKLQKYLYQTGLEFLDLKGFALSAPEYEQQLQIKNENLRRQQQLISDQEYNALLLKYEQQLEEMCLEHNIRLRQKASGMLDGMDIKSLALIEKEMSPEVKSKVRQSMTDFVTSTTTENIYPQVFNQHVSPRVFIALLTQIVSFSPCKYKKLVSKKNLQEYPGYDCYDLADYSLGGLCSVRAIKYKEQNLIVAGAVNGLYLIRPSGAMISQMCLARESNSKRGINSLVIIANMLYATHSEQGLISWDITREKDKGQYLHRKITAGSNTIRGIIEEKGILYFAVDNFIYCLDSQQKQLPLIAVYRGNSEEITSIVVIDEKLYASNAKGQLWCWDLDSPEKPSCLLQTTNTIYMLKKTLINNENYLLLGYKDYGVLALAIANDTQVKYQASMQVRWIDGSPDFITGVSRDLKNILLWPSNAPQTPPIIIPTPTPINDINVKKMI